MSYINGSDLLVLIGNVAVGHCTTHTATFSTETKDTAVKAAKSVTTATTSPYKNKRITGLAVQVKADGIVFSSEAECGFKDILQSWKSGTPVTLKLLQRGTDTEPYCEGSFIISSLENTAPAGEDATYSATFDSDGAVTVDEDEFDPEEEDEEE